ncbi:MAG TPA: LON peptidase substrate-binding domain-containing protein [Thermoanaerobaculia bacterium]|nr:LON peptidase substrate-binding domain-containing protein [Thermoanaerobaculia bacterium]
MTARRLPLFPLPGVVLLPGTLLPLHVFEPRYSAMVTDALAGDRLIGMAMLKPGWENAAEPPPIYAVGGAGEIVESEDLEDGRFNIVLEGRFRYRVLDEAAPGPYRLARVEEIPPAAFRSRADRDGAVAAAAAAFSEIAGELELPPLPAGILSPERLASEIALRLRYAPPELQAFLEMDSLAARYETLTGRMLEWHNRIRFLAPFRPRELDVGRN